LTHAGYAPLSIAYGNQVGGFCHPSGDSNQPIRPSYFPAMYPTWIPPLFDGITIIFV